MLQNFSDRLKDARIELRLTQADLADLLGISRNYVSLLETNIRNPTMSVVDVFESRIQPKLEAKKQIATTEKRTLETKCADCHRKDKRILQLEEQLSWMLKSVESLTRQLEAKKDT